MSSSVLPSGRLRILFPLPASSTRGYKSTVVIVPHDCRLRPATSWTDGSACWLKSILPDILEQPLVLEFQHCFQHKEKFVWHKFCEDGDALMKLLLQLATESAFLKRPLVFICHGYGGLIVKRAISVIYEQFHQPEFDRLLSTFAAVVFLGCPHPTFDEPDYWESSCSLLRTDSRFSKANINEASKNVVSIAHISKMFDESSSDIKIISAFEGRRSKTRLMSLKKVFLVGESLARTNSKRETLIKVDATHADLCNLTKGSEFYNKLQETLEITKHFTPRYSTSTVSNMVLPQSLQGWSVVDPNELKQLASSPHQSSGEGGSNINAQASSSDRSAWDIVPDNPVLGEIKTVTLPCYMLKQVTRLPEFCGRDKVMSMLEAHLIPRNQASSVDSSPSLLSYALCGTGGLGKTQIAIEFACTSMQRKDFDAIFWVAASNQGNLAKSFSDIAVGLGLEKHSNHQEQAVSRDLVLEWLSRPVRQIVDGAKLPPDADFPSPKWLLIFDNADNLQILQDYWPLTGKGSILVTSRDPMAKGKMHIPCDTGIELPPFEVSDAAGLLRSITGYNQPEDKEPSEQIAERLSCFPMAVVQNAKTIARRSLSFKEFLRFYDDGSTRREFNDLAFNGLISAADPKTISTVLALNDCSLAATSVLEFLSFMDPDRIPEFLFVDIIGKLDILGIPFENYPASENDFAKARTEISTSSLVRRNIELQELRTHRIIQDTNRSGMSDDKFQAVFDAVVKMLSHAWPFSEFDWDTKRWSRCEPIVPHISHLSLIYNSSEYSKRNLNASAQFARLLMELGWYHIERGNLTQAPEFLDSSKKVCESVGDETRITNADVCYCRAELASMIGKPEAALPFALENLELVGKYDPKGWRYPQAHNCLTAVYLGTGDFEKVAIHADLAIRGYATLETPEFVDFPHINKAYGLMLTERQEEASKVLENYLKEELVERGKEGTESFKTAGAKSLLGAIYRDLGRYEDSQKMLDTCLVQFRDTVGETNVRMANTYESLGDTHGKLDNFEIARDMYSKALGVFAVDGDQVPEESRVFFKLSRAYDRLGSVEEAQKAREMAQKLLDTLGPDLTEKDINGFLPAWARTKIECT